MNKYIKDLTTIIRDGNMENTYKMSWIRSIVEHSTINPHTKIIPFDNLSPLIFKYYWNQTIFFDLKQGPNLIKKPEIHQLVLKEIDNYKKEVNQLPVFFTKVENRINVDIKSINKTLGDVDSFMELTTGSLYDPDFYRITVSEAISQAKPFVLVFSSPAFCTNAVCGPQLEVLQSLKNKHKEKFIFIHVDIYDDPQQVQSNFENAKISPIVKEWHLPTSLWTFIIGGKGQIKYRFEAFASESEIENALNQIY